MNYKIKHSLLFILIYCLWNISIKAQSFIEEIKINKSYAVTPTATVEVINKYGNIHISTWEKDSVKFEVNYIISEKNEVKFNKAKDNVDFKFSGNSSYRTAETIFGTKYGTFIKDIQEATNLFNGATGSHISYYITLPSYVNLKIDNRYGNIFIPDYEGNLNISLSNGDFQGRNLSGDNNLNFAFGDVDIKEVKQGNLAFNFNKVTIQKLDLINIDSKSSTLKITEGNLLKIQSRRDEIYIDNLKFIYGTTYFSKVTLYNLSKEFNLSMQYGELEHLQLSSNFELAKLNSRFSNATILVKDPKPYSCSIYSEKGEIDIPNDLKAQNQNWKESINSTAETFSYQGNNLKAKLQVTLKDAFFKLIHN